MVRSIQTVHLMTSRSVSLVAFGSAGSCDASHDGGGGPPVLVGQQAKAMTQLVQNELSHRWVN